MIMEIPTSDVQMQDPQLERLVASVPALYSDAFDITQIMELYSFPDEDDITNSSFPGRLYLEGMQRELCNVGINRIEHGSPVLLFLG